jgi:hypothetical protein
MSGQVQANSNNTAYGGHVFNGRAMAQDAIDGFHFRQALSPLEQGETLRATDAANAADCAPGRYDQYGYVKVHFVKGDKESEANAKQLAQHLTQIDRKINALPDDIRIPVLAKNGDILGHVTGARVKAAWRDQRWEFHPGTSVPQNGMAAATGTGITMWTKRVATDYQYARGSMPFDTYFKSIIAHEMGHIWRVEISTRTDYEESMANEAAAAVMNAIGMPFNHESNFGSRMKWDAPDFPRNGRLR